MKAVRTFFKFFFLILLAVAVIGTMGGAFYIRSVISDAPELDLATIAPASSASYICDQDGKKTLKLTLPESNRDLVGIENIPKDLQHAFVAIEDSRFYRHHGIDPVGIFRALVRGVLRGSFSEGASTITQQLLKNSLFTGWTTEQNFDDRLKRKIQEQYLAVRLEKVLTKDQILEYYLNVINLGAGCYGVQAASYKYFGKEVSSLTLSECAVIAAITQNPTRYNPITHPEENAERRKAVLDYMLDQGYCSEEACKEALLDDVYARISLGSDAPETQTSIYTWYQDALIDQVIQDLIDEKGYTDKQAIRMVYSGGLRIYSAEDPAICQICEEAFRDPANFPEGSQAGLDYALSIQHPDGEVIHYGNSDLSDFLEEHPDPAWSGSEDLLFENQEAAAAAAAAFREAYAAEEDTVLGERITITPQPQAAMVVMDQATGFVRAVIGGRGTKEASLTLNRAVSSYRQPGSTFKILSVYAPALDAAGKTLATKYDSSEYTLEDGTTFSNWDLSADGEPVTIRDAIVRSVNTAAVRCLMEITPDLGFSYAKSLGISSLVSSMTKNGQTYSDLVPSLALGGLTNGVCVLDLCSAYACIANEGRYLPPHFYTKVCNSDGEVLLDHTVSASRTILKPSTAYLLTDAMRGVISDPDGTAYGTIRLGDMDAAGKSGTTSAYRDVWFAGYTPYYTCCVWGGYDNNSVLPSEGIGHNYQKVLWNAVMKKIHQDLPARSFVIPSDIVTVQICDSTGELAAPGCPSHPEIFASTAQPLTTCSLHGSGQNTPPAASQNNLLPTNPTSPAASELPTDPGQTNDGLSGNENSFSQEISQGDGSEIYIFQDSGSTTIPAPESFDPGSSAVTQEISPEISQEISPEISQQNSPEASQADSMENPITILHSDETVLDPSADAVAVG